MLLTFGFEMPLVATIAALPSMLFMKKTVLIALTVPAFIGAITLYPVENQKVEFHTNAEHAFFKEHGLSVEAFEKQLGESPDFLPIDSTILFPTAKLCGGCHGHDPNGHALVTTSGEDVNIYDRWRSTMMANSAKDPFWRAKVTHEILVNPSHSLALQDKCTSCHAPAGHYQAKLQKHQLTYTLADLYSDTLGLDGVNCQACHAQSPLNIGSTHSGQLNYDTNHIRVAYGPYELVFAPPMHEFVGITPEYGEHILDGGLCAGCHTLITNTVDLEGHLTGNTFVEQATYHEWLNSRYDRDHDNVSCQTCHVPQLQDEIIISANYQFLTPKFPFGLHELAGANVSMLKLLKENRQALGITAEPQHFDSTIVATLRMLQHNTLDMELNTGILNGDSVDFSVKLSNKAGHKFPSGYPSRRAWIEFEVENEAGEVVFHSGRMNADYSLPDEDANFEPHYDWINAPGQVQIYELVPGDVNGNFTNVLERGDEGIKDNRLTPQGFRISDPVYDTTLIIGAALLDPDFNRDAAGMEGSGSDIVHYRIATHGYDGLLKVRARVWYQSLPPKWMMPMFEYSSPEIDSFKNMFNAADRSPVLVAERVLDSVLVSSVATHQAVDPSLVQVTPTLSRDGQVHIQTSGDVQLRRIQIWDSAGHLVWDQPARAVWLPADKGVYFIAIDTNKGRVVRRVVRG